MIDINTSTDTANAGIEHVYWDCSLKLFAKVFFNTNITLQ